MKWPSGAARSDDFSQGDTDADVHRVRWGDVSTPLARSEKFDAPVYTSTCPDYSATLTFGWSLNMHL